MCAVEQGYNREAEAYFLDGLHIAPDHTLILVALGRLYSDTRRYSDAAAALLQATQHDPQLWEAWLELGRVHMKEKKWQRALSALEQARQQHGMFSAAIYIAMTTCYVRLGKKVEGRKLLNEVLQREPSNQDAIKLQKQLN
jgi:cytochrome c-type biogenesis protein CcmH/NrfG